MTKEPSLFNEFKKRMPSNEALIESVLLKIVGTKPDSRYIKMNFSKLVEQINSDIYDAYLKAQTSIGNKILKDYFRL